MKLLDIITFIHFYNMIAIYGEDILYIEGYPDSTKFEEYYDRDIGYICSDHDTIVIEILPE